MIADQAVNHVERFIVDAGHTAQRVEKDYGYDLILFTFDEQGYAEPGLAFLQLKPSETLEPKEDGYTFDADVRDYNLWMLEPSPVFLVLFDASRRQAWWLHVQKYFREDRTRRPKHGAKTVRVRVPARQRVSRRALVKVQQIKNEAAVRLKREV